MHESNKIKPIGPSFVAIFKDSPTLSNQVELTVDCH